MSTLGGSLLKIFTHFIGIKILGSYNFDNIKKSIVDLMGGKMLMNLSNLMTKVSIESLNSFFNNINRVIPESLSKYGDKYANENVCYVKLMLVRLDWLGDYQLKELFFLIFMHNQQKKILNIN